MNQNTNAQQQQQYPQQFSQQQYFPQQQFNPQIQQQFGQQFNPQQQQQYIPQQQFYSQLINTQQQYAQQFGQQQFNQQYPQQQFYPQQFNTQQQFGQQQFSQHLQQFGQPMQQYSQQFGQNQQFNTQQQQQQQFSPQQQFGQQVNPQQKQPKTCDEIMALHKQLGKTPEGTVKLTLDAIFLYMDPNTRQEGKKALEKLVIDLMKNPRWERTESSFVEKMKNPEHHHIFRSYAVGASPENGYAMDPANYQLNVEKSFKDKYGRQVVFLRSLGAYSARPVYMRQGAEDGLYYCSGVQNLYVNVKKPIKPGEKQIQKFI